MMRSSSFAFIYTHSSAEFQNFSFRNALSYHTVYINADSSLIIEGTIS